MVLLPRHLDLIRAGADRMGVSVDAPTVERLRRYLTLLLVWNERLRLTGERDVEVLVGKHVVDCLAPCMELPASGRIVDIGAGAGFPGLVLGCVRPDLSLLLLESRRRPTSFLREAIRTIPLAHATVSQQRAEAAKDDAALAGSAAVVTGRAVGLERLLSWASPLVAPDGVVVAMQTPSVDVHRGERLAASAGLAVRRVRDYRLPGGETRRLLVFVPRVASA